MIKRLLPSCLVLAALLSAGCLHSKNTPKPKDPTISNEVENDFRQRWTDKRTAELLAQGQTADAARSQAGEEFRARYGFMGAPQK